MNILKIILILIIIFIPEYCFAIENIDLSINKNYILSTDKNVKTIALSNPEIISVCPFFTIFNEKNVLLIHPQKIGKSTLALFQEKQEVIFLINVIQKDIATPVIKTEGFDLTILDEPPKIKEMEINSLPPIDIFEIDAPPTAINEGI